MDRSGGGPEAWRRPAAKVGIKGRAGMKSMLPDLTCALRACQVRSESSLSSTFDAPETPLGRLDCCIGHPARANIAPEPVVSARGRYVKVQGQRGLSRGC